MISFKPPQIEDTADIEDLLDRAFGRHRTRKTSYRYRTGLAPVPGLSLIARDRGELVGTIAFWPVRIGEAAIPALLLGPLAVDPERRGEGIGVALMYRGIEAATRAGHRLAVLVGERNYYARFGFEPAGPTGIYMPGEPKRLMVRALTADGLEGVSGRIRRGRSVRRRLKAA